jgi:polyhydroxybutyrate depolymerase
MIRIAAIAALAIAASAAATAETIRIDGTDRTFHAVVAESKPAPLVLVLHGNTQQGADMQTRTAWPEVARREHFTAAFPDGLNRAWADLRGDADRAGRKAPPGTDDGKFLMELVAAYVREGLADPKRIYVTGVSNGGAMAMTLACTHPETFAAAASVIISLTPAMARACKPPQAIPMLLMNGTADPLVAYQGGKGTSRFALPDVLPTQQTVAFWRKVNGCDAADGISTALPNHDPDNGSTVTRIDSRCPPQRDVVLYRINDGGHRMPGAKPDARMPRAVDAVLGPQNHDIDGAETIWAFFKGFTR